MKIIFQSVAILLAVLGAGNGTDAQRLEVGSSLLPGDTVNKSFVISQSGAFAFGFYSINPNSYGVGIWYNKLRGRQVVWMPTTTTSGSPLVGVTVDSNATLQLTGSGDLNLRDKYGSLLWTTNTTARSVSLAEILDTGNFVLRNNGSASPANIVWSTFDNPADTLLPAQTLTVNASLNSAGTLSRYSLGIQNMGRDTVLALFWNQTKIYKNLTVSSSLNSTVLDSSGRFSVRNASGNTIASWLSSDYQDSSLPLRKVTMDVDGNLKIYSWDVNAADWKVGWQAFEDECQVNGLCGQYGLCTYVSGTRTCKCPPGFVPVSKVQNWTSEGCTRLTPLNCPSPTVLRLENTVFFWDGTNFLIGNATNEAVCRQSVQDTPAVTGATFPNNGSGMCIQKRAPFVSGYQSQTTRAVSFIRICGEAVPSETGGGNEMVCLKSKKTLLVALVSSSASLNFVLFALLLVSWRLINWQRTKTASSGEGQWDPLLFNMPGSLVNFPFQILEEATENFKEKLGSGGFGSVYRGLLVTMNMPVAVKKLEDFQEQGEKEFRAEVALVGRTHHFNLIRLLGFCSEGPQRLLVYEYMPRGSLDRYIFKTGGDDPILDWKTRLNIAIGAAKGIAYLHEECREAIVHCDIKPQNILLDANFQAKVSDFGLSKMVGRRPQESSMVRGSPGYMAPEWLSDAPLTCKVDVFSFGIVLLEIVGGRPNLDLCMEEEEKKVYSTWAFGMARRGEYVAVVDERVREEAEVEEARRAVNVAFWCIQQDAAMRPPMGRVVQMLQGAVTVEELPTVVDSKNLGHGLRSLSYSSSPQLSFE